MKKNICDDKHHPCQIFQRDYCSYDIEIYKECITQVINVPDGNCNKPLITLDEKQIRHLVADAYHMGQEAKAKEIKTALGIFKE